ncbi:branched-chain amino acid transport system permease protein [Rhodopseudomonas rhenobacensis]|uniref:Branched-chain amino acid transport system permease protein n=1 Tax=Rhodopseudomonas rhenobacensis TaxID=87461 RepID=A0A7W7Z7D8_9BRAD|nr:branched-chain amino acid ABC transporter permease [Rhodopseudomonas rhenobacensis]MBB5049359.1 branched-chain amino acid transport system permease protein [Rhodopseudomonas rhenobacensis]
MARLNHRYVILVVLAAVIALLPLVFPSSYYLRVAALVWVSAFAAIGLNILMGKAGQVSLGHAGFFGIGAYAVAILPARFGLPSLVALAIGAALSALLAFLVGRPILRLKGHYLAIATLGFGVLVAMVITTESRWTGGPDGMAVAKLSLFGWRASGSATWYWITGGLLLIGAWIALNLDDTPTGRAFRALHDSEIAARVTGVDVNRFKLQAFVIAAVYGSIAGSALAMMNGFINPDQAGFLHSVELVTMVVLGGLGSVVGSIVGAAVLIVLPQLLTVFQDYENLMLGAIIILSMIFMRDGMVPMAWKLLTRTGR